MGRRLRASWSLIGTASVALVLLACAPASSPAEVVLPPAGSVGPVESAGAPTATAPRKVDVFAEAQLPDPPLEGLEPNERAIVRQETWSGPGDFQQHCRELSYPQRHKDEIVRETNAAIEQRGVPPRLPETVRKAPLLFAMSDFKPALVEVPEPLVKLILCTEAPHRRDERDRFVAVMQRHHLVPSLPFGEPKIEWVRAFVNGRHEWGVAFAKTQSDEAIAATLLSLGFVEQPGQSPRIWTKTHPPERIQLRGELWWSSAD